MKWSHVSLNFVMNVYGMKADLDKDMQLVCELGLVIALGIEQSAPTLIAVRFQ
jgi:hypothetical protein